MEFECQGSTEVSDKFLNHVENSCQEENIVVNQFSSVCLTENSGISKLVSSCHPKNGVSIMGTRQLPGNSILTNFRRSITDLPQALVSEILNCLDAAELGVVSCVSTTFRRIASEHHLWKKFYCDRWALPVAPVPVGAGFSDDKSWKELFVEREFRSQIFSGRYISEVLHGHKEAVKTVCLLASAKFIFTAGYDSVVRMWGMEDGLSIATSRSLGCTIRAIAADRKLLVAGGTDGFIHCWKAFEGHPHLFDIKSTDRPDAEFRLWEHGGPISSLALDHMRIYSGSWDMTVRIWNRSLMKCIQVLTHSDWVLGLVPHDTTVVSTAGSDMYIWDIESGILLNVVNNANVSNINSLARSHSGDFVFTGLEDGTINMFEIINYHKDYAFLKVVTWIPHTGPVNSLAFEFPWLVSASGDGKLALIDVRKWLRTSRRSTGRKISRANLAEETTAQPPQRMLHGFGCLNAVDIGSDRIVCAGEEGVVRVWNFSDALESERRSRDQKSKRQENRMRRRRLQMQLNSKGGHNDHCSFAAKNLVIDERSGVWHSKRRTTLKVKA